MYNSRQQINFPQNDENRAKMTPKMTPFSGPQKTHILPFPPRRHVSLRMAEISRKIFR